MPMTGSIGNRIAEFHHGKTYAKTKAKFGKKTADKQAIAASYASAGRSIGEIHRSMSKKK